MSSRRFTEKQTADIIRKAAEHARGGAQTGPEGVSEVELRAAAKELGIEPAAVDLALRDFDEVPVPSRAGFWGGPFRREQELVFDGAITEDRWEEIVHLIRGAFGETGKVERRGSTYEWVGTGGGVVTIRQSGATLRMLISSDFSVFGFLGFMLAFLPTLATIAILSKAQLPTPWGPAIGWSLFLIYFLLVRGWTTSLSKKQRQKISQLASRVQQVVATPTESAWPTISNLGSAAADGAETTKDVLG